MPCPGSSRIRSGLNETCHLCHHPVGAAPAAHAFLMLLVGAALGGSGAAYQGLFRNPLADPYLIGVASGAGLGAVIAMSINFPLYNHWVCWRSRLRLLAWPLGRSGWCTAGPGGKDHPHHQPDPGRRGGQFLCNRPDLLDHAAFAG